MRLISWNVQWGRDASGDVDLPRTLAEAKRIADFDVLCLQEITRGFESLPGGPSGDQFAELAVALPGYAVLEGIGADLPALEAGAPRRQFGNAIVTRLPIEQVFRHTLPWPADPSAPSMQRVALEAVLRAPGGPVRVVTTHLEFYSLTQRLAQVDALRALHLQAAAHAAQPAPAENATSPFAATTRPVSAIVCGDFNSAFASEAYRRFLAPLNDNPHDAPGFVDAWTALHPGKTPPMTAGVYDKAQWSSGPMACDFVFVTEDLLHRLRRCEIDSATHASDHQPVLLELE
jgi:endonuclease/exonuclease/phosphatase family metal-dependent hydrolase